ncbi:MAG: hypothetical protein JST26_18890 [Bacteroidetes bacterium]|nr:hypothetical protein [Bacteroidota bacterium]
MELQEILSTKISEADVRIIARKALKDKGLLDTVFNLVFHPDEKINNRASWILGHICDLDLSVMKNRDRKILGLLKSEEGLKGGRTRNILRIYNTRTVPESCSSDVLDTCYRFLKDPSYAIAIRAFSITVIYNISKPYPELLEELKLVLNDLLKHDEAPAIINRGYHTLEKIEKMNRKKS